MSCENENYHLGYKKRYWTKILFTGFVIYVASIISLVLTSNIHLFPTVVLIGNFLVPVSFVAFFYERRNKFSLNMPSTALSFFYGGVLGTITAALLEPVFISSLTLRSAFVVGIIEEFTKLIGVLTISRCRRHDSQIDGIVLGAAAGMGFAAFESTGYAFNTFLQSGGSLSHTVLITLIRGLASPVGHGTWTAILSSVLFRESAKGRFIINGSVIGAYVAVVLLHGLWDAMPFLVNLNFPLMHSVISGQLFVGAVSILLLMKHWRQAKMHSSFNFL